MRNILILLSCFLIAISLAAVPIEATEVVISIAGPGILEKRAVTLFLESPGSDSPSIERKISSEGDKPALEASLELPSGSVWTARLGNGVLSPTVEFEVKDPRVAIELLGVASGSVTASLLPPQGTTLRAKDVVARYSWPGSDLPAQSPCLQAGNDWTCEVPAGILDFSLRARGHISHYFWNKPVPAGRKTAVGTLQLRAGASLTGYVKSEGKAVFDSARCRVALQPVLGGSSPQGKDKLLEIATRPNPKGFFHFEGVSPHEYFVVATQPGLVGSMRRVTVIEGSEAALRDPLFLTIPLDVEIVVSPSTDPSGSPWKVTLSEFTGPTSVQFFDSSATDKTGRCKFPEVAPERRYGLSVEAANGMPWWFEEFATETEAKRILIDMSIVNVAGTVRSGDEPLSIDLLFGGERGATRIKMVSDENGAFEGKLPRPGSWIVTATKESPDASIKFWSNQKVEAPQGGGPAHLEIAVPEGRLIVEAVDGNGNALKKYVLTVSRPPGGSSGPMPSSQWLRESSPFTIRGLAPGPAVVAISTPQGKASKQVEIKDSSEVRVRLVVNQDQELRGRVVSSQGAGVPGAVLQPLVPSSPGSSSPASPTTTGPDGAFTLKLPSGTGVVPLAVLPPGFANRILSAATTGGEEVTILVGQDGGQLTLSWPGTLLGTASERAFLFAPAGGLPVFSFTRDGRTSSYLTDGRVTFMLPSMEEGRYTLCLVPVGQLASSGPLLPNGKCASSQLTRLGAAEIRIP
ncbi:MAG: carboxypeptidase regulatory-like domain-containing protein [Acidobacteria bacterium]|nr:carboxypeptidase regulatory-like domain-containing protein [Acidobacteriota bacterium]MCG3194089.1 hypothetical protein [Thermoanaerobaculia bacterium]MCK6681662.1 carboxypeptidase-like regulatory domain-containing protein [Thermoanaerobaculia bacterium]